MRTRSAGPKTKTGKATHQQEALKESDQATQSLAQAALSNRVPSPHMRDKRSFAQVARGSKRAPQKPMTINASSSEPEPISSDALTSLSTLEDQITHPSTTTADTGNTAQDGLPKPREHEEGIDNIAPSKRLNRDCMVMLINPNETTTLHIALPWNSGMPASEQFTYVAPPLAKKKRARKGAGKKKANTQTGPQTPTCTADHDIEPTKQSPASIGSSEHVEEPPVKRARKIAHDMPAAHSAEGTSNPRPVSRGSSVYWDQVDANLFTEPLNVEDLPEHLQETNVWGASTSPLFQHSLEQAIPDANLPPSSRDDFVGLEPLADGRALPHTSSQSLYMIDQPDPAKASSSTLEFFPTASADIFWLGHQPRNVYESDASEMTKLLNRSPPPLRKQIKLAPRTSVPRIPERLAGPSYLHPSAPLHPNTKSDRPPAQVNEHEPPIHPAGGATDRHATSLSTPPPSFLDAAIAKEAQAPPPIPDFMRAAMEANRAVIAKSNPPARIPHTPLPWESTQGKDPDWRVKGMRQDQYDLFDERPGRKVVLHFPGCGTQDESIGEKMANARDLLAREYQKPAVSFAMFAAQPEEPHNHPNRPPYAVILYGQEDAILERIEKKGWHHDTRGAFNALPFDKTPPELIASWSHKERFPAADDAGIARDIANTMNTPPHSELLEWIILCDIYDKPNSIWNGWTVTDAAKKIRESFRVRTLPRRLPGSISAPLVMLYSDPPTHNIDNWTLYRDYVQALDVGSVQSGTPRP